MKRRTGNRERRDRNRLAVRTIAYALLATLMRERLTDGDSLQVNSRHHQAPKVVAKGFRISATAPDGVVEAIEAKDGRWLVAVQWHPENLTDDAVSRRLFREFVAEVRRSIDYYRSRGGDVNHILLCGGAAKMRGLGSFLTKSMGVTCDNYDAFRRLNVSAKKVAPD